MFGSACCRAETDSCSRRAAPKAGNLHGIAATISGRGALRAKWTTGLIDLASADIVVAVPGDRGRVAVLSHQSQSHRRAPTLGATLVQPFLR